MPKAHRDFVVPPIYGRSQSSTPKPTKEGTPAQIIRHPCSTASESRRRLLPDSEPRRSLDELFPASDHLLSIFLRGHCYSQSLLRTQHLGRLSTGKKLVWHSGRLHGRTQLAPLLSHEDQLSREPSSRKADARGLALELAEARARRFRETPSQRTRNGLIKEYSLIHIL